MATALSFVTDPKHQPAPRTGVAELIASLAHGDVPWLRPEWLATVGALPDNFAPSGRSDIEEGFHELFAATTMDCGLGASISFYDPFDDTMHLTRWTEEKEPTYYSDWIHELAHGTGHPCRLGRDLPPAFGYNVHGIEDLIAEITTSIVCLDLGFAPRLRHTECIPVWIELLRADRQAFASAVRHAREAAGFLFYRRDYQAECFAQEAAEELREERDVRAREAEERRGQRQAERERWALRSATVKGSGESLPARRLGGIL
jgi:antirestriction protein ArdC